MFEYAVPDNSSSKTRAWTTGCGFAVQCALAASILVAPMIWPQALPRPRLTLILAPPPPAPNPPEHTLSVTPRTLRSAPIAMRTDLLLPARIPDRVARIMDATGPIAAPQIEVVGGLGAAGNGGSSLPTVLGSMPAVSKPVVATPAKPARAPEEVKRIRMSSLDPARLLHVVEPRYPQIAKAARIEGTVELRAVIGTDGRVRELTIVSGHPLLRKAAVDAVRQWIYKPPVLNGESVEIVAPIAVVFRLN